MLLFFLSRSVLLVAFEGVLQWGGVEEQAGKEDSEPPQKEMLKKGMWARGREGDINGDMSDTKQGTEEEVTVGRENAKQGN